MASWAHVGREAPETQPKMRIRKASAVSLFPLIGLFWKTCDDAVDPFNAEQ